MQECNHPERSPGFSLYLENPRAKGGILTNGIRHLSISGLNQHSFSSGIVSLAV